MDYTRITKSQVKFIHSLKLKKFRQKYNKFTIEGEKIVTELLSSNHIFLENIIISEEYSQKNHIPTKYQDRILIASSKNMEMMSQFKHAPPILALASNDESMLIDKDKNKGKFIYLENIQDPGNAGTILRTADWFGYDGVYFSENSVDVYNHKVIQSSMGSVFRIPHAYITYEDLSSKTITKIATTLQGEPIESFLFPADYIICFGNEGQGLTEKVTKQCKENLLIDSSHSKGAESLNIAISAGIVLYAGSVSKGN